MINLHQMMPGAWGPVLQTVYELAARGVDALERIAVGLEAPHVPTQLEITGITALERLSARLEPKPEAPEAPRVTMEPLQAPQDTPEAPHEPHEAMEPPATP